jgi:hypothetical protein
MVKQILDTILSWDEYKGALFCPRFIPRHGKNPGDCGTVAGIGTHILEHIADLRAGGMDEEEAFARAVDSLGWTLPRSVDTIKRPVQS